MIDIEGSIREFIGGIDNDLIEVYNEASLQFELGIYLRGVLGKQYKIQFERNLKDDEIFGREKYNEVYSQGNKPVKHEIDIVIISKKKKKSDMPLN